VLGGLIHEYKIAPRSRANRISGTLRLLRFADHYRQIARPFEWTFSRADLDRLLARIDAHEPQLRLAA
jgi:hypothetical protein